MKLTPAQEAAYNSLKLALKAGNLLVLTSHAGRGRTTVLRRLQAETGGGFVTSKEFLENSGARHPLSLEEALHSAVAAALDEHDIVYVDDVDLILTATSNCHSYPRGQ
jgi:ABC-type hemin transport system ATPase subunit